MYCRFRNWNKLLQYRTRRTFVFVFLPMFKKQNYTVSSLQLRRAHSVAAVKQEGEPEPYLLGQPPERRPDYRNQLRY